MTTATATHTKSTADHIKDVAKKPTEEHVLSKAHHVEHPKQVEDSRPDPKTVQGRLERLENWLAHLQAIYKWPLPDDMVAQDQGAAPETTGD